MTIDIDTGYFQELAGKDSGEVCRRALCSYSPNDRCYTLSILNEEYGIYPHESRITRVSDGKEDITIYMALFIICYLLGSKDTPIHKEWISEKDIPGGLTFFTGPHAIPVDLITQNRNDHIRSFVNSCKQLSGTPIDMADAAFLFRMAPRIPVAVLLWEKDDEFPAESRLLFDRTITEHLALDVIFGMTVELCKRIGRFMDSLQ